MSCLYPVPWHNWSSQMSFDWRWSWYLWSTGCLYIPHRVCCVRGNYYFTPTRYKSSQDFDLKNRSLTFLLFSNTFSQTVDVHSFLANAFLCVWPSTVHFSPWSFQVTNKTYWSLYISPICSPFPELSYSFLILFKSSKFKVNWIPVFPNPEKLLLDFSQYKWCRTVTSTAYLNPAALHLGSSDSTNPLKT